MFASMDWKTVIQSSAFQSNACHDPTGADESSLLLGRDYDSTYQRPNRIDNELAPVAYKSRPENDSAQYIRL